jgi:hypothetical protein
MAGEALRVLGMAYRKLLEVPACKEDSEAGAVFVGLAGMIVAGIISGQLFFYLLAGIYAFALITTNATSDRYQAAKRSKAVGDIILSILFISLLSYQHLAIIPILFWMLSDPNYNHKGFLTKLQKNKEKISSCYTKKKVNFLNYLKNSSSRTFTRPSTSSPGSGSLATTT